MGEVNRVIRIGKDVPRPSIDQGLSDAQTRLAEGDVSAALALWADLRDQFPKHSAAYLRAAASLRKQSKFNEAEDLLAKACQAFPEQAAPAIDYARVAEERRDWAQALLRWEQVCKGFPQHVAGHIGIARSLREQHRYDEAEALLALALEHFPSEAGPLIEHAWLAQHQRRWTAAGYRWDRVRQRFPDQLSGYIAGAQTLREADCYEEAEALLQIAMERFPDQPTPMSEYAWLANHKRDWPAAAQRWNLLVERHPERLDGYIRSAGALKELWRFDEAEQFLLAAIERFPSVPEPAGDYAWIAFAQSKYAQALQRFSELRGRFPNCPAGYLGGAQALRITNRRAESERLLEEAMLRFPHDPAIKFEHALAPIYSSWKGERNPEEAARRLRMLLQEFPNFERGYLLGAKSLRERGNPDLAEEFTVLGFQRFPNNVGIVIEYATTALDRSDWQEAQARFKQAKERFADNPKPVIGLATCCVKTARFKEAEIILQDAMKQFPKSAEVFSAYAMAAAEMGDWASSLQRWTAAEQRFPQNREIGRGIYHAKLRLSDTAADSGIDPAPPTVTNLNLISVEISSGPDKREQMSQLAMQFESLGGKGLGCEFGIFQRNCGAEPLGLLRWAEINPDKLIQVLANRFDGVGMPENTKLFADTTKGRPEYCTVDIREMMFSRTFVYADEIPEEKMFKQICRRLQFLTRKLIGDLESGDKIFVYKIVDRNLTDIELSQLHTLMRGYGNNTLLYVQYEDPTHPNGTVELVQPGLMIGYIDYFKMSRTGEVASVPPTASWAAICKRAYEVWQREKTRHEVFTA